MARAVLDPAVLVSALITPTGTPAKLLIAARGGSFELIVSPLLLGELESVLRREKFRRYVDLDAVDQYVELLRRDAAMAADPAEPPPIHCADPDDDYLIALAHSRSAALVSGDGHLVELAGRIPVFTPSEFLAALQRGSPGCASTEGQAPDRDDLCVASSGLRTRVLLSTETSGPRS